MGEYFLFVAKDTVLRSKTADSAAKKGTDSVEAPSLHAFQKKVQLGQTVGPNVVVKSGINIGDSIVVDGVQAIHEGSRINASPAKQPDGHGQDSTGRHKADSSSHK